MVWRRINDVVAERKETTSLGKVAGNELRIWTLDQLANISEEEKGERSLEEPFSGIVSTSD